jgi:hypothetical protein
MHKRRRKRSAAHIQICDERYLAGHGIGNSDIDLAGRFYDSHMKIAHDSNVLKLLNISVTLSQQTLKVGTIMILRHIRSWTVAFICNSVRPLSHLVSSVLYTVLLGYALLVCSWLRISGAFPL